jgi:hypothetical protein
MIKAISPATLSFLRAFLHRSIDNDFSPSTSKPASPAIAFVQPSNPVEKNLRNFCLISTRQDTLSRGGFASAVSILGEPLHVRSLTSLPLVSASTTPPYFFITMLLLAPRFHSK